MAQLRTNFDFTNSYADANGIQMSTTVSNPFALLFANGHNNLKTGAIMSKTQSLVLTFEKLDESMNFRSKEDNRLRQSSLAGDKKPKQCNEWDEIAQEFELKQKIWAFHMHTAQ